MALRLLETITLILGVFFVGYYLIKRTYKLITKHKITFNKCIQLWR